jgi:hypothetical protein
VSGHLVFALPDYLEEALFALPVLTHYLALRGVIGNHPESVTVICKNSELTKLIKAHWPSAAIVQKPEQSVLDKADMVYDFDTERAYRLTEKIEKHIAEAYGIQLGVGLTRILPPIFVEDWKEENGYLLVVERNKRDRPLEGALWPHREKFIEVGQEQKIPMGYLDSGAYFEETRCAVGKAAAVVGVRGTATLIAAAAGKIVFELSPDSQHAKFMTKWENRRYRMAYGKLEEMVVEFVWDRLVKLVGELKGNQVQAEPVEV